MAKTNKTTKYVRIVTPDRSRRTFSLQEKNQETGKWQTVSNPLIDALNEQFINKTLTLSDAKARAKVIREQWYAERDKDQPRDLVIPGNQRILDKFLAEVYTPIKLRRIKKRSFPTEVNYFYAALRAIGDLPIDGALEPLQHRLDELYEQEPKVHVRRVASINRLRKYLSLPPLLHLKSELHEVKYISYAQVMELINKADDPVKTMIAVAFYTGMRLGEIWGIKPEEVKGDTVHVNRQMLRDGTYDLPKMGRRRRALILPGGKEWLARWFILRDEGEGLSRNIKPSDTTQALAGIRFHDLRHCVAVYMISKGATIDWVARHLGHTRQTCERSYASHVLDDDSLTMLRGILKPSFPDQEM